MPLSSVEEIKVAIARLSDEDVARVREWVASYADRLWDEKIKRDERAERLDTVIDQALHEHRTLRTRPL
ncbi:hypothetical protein [Tautonia marina]|uniref:hypothetical protein n=1 Tax=Tautonia marina TaxID=2653855 RepID=UPI0012611E1E|nr:hypothetical protein [Tautonia marina]